MARRTLLVGFLVIFSLLLGACQQKWELLTAQRAVQAPPPACATDIDTTKNNWGAFRKNHPYHFQAISISKPFGAGCRTLVLSEPPPHVTLADLTRVASTALSTSATLRHPVGHDGWLADLAFTLPPMTDAELQGLVGLIHLYAFRTSYKAHAFSLEAPVSRPADVNLDVRVGPDELKRWVLDEQTLMQPVDGGTPIRAKSALEQGGAGVYFGRPGLVVWAIPRARSLDTMAPEARRFAVESDLLVGAIGGSRGVLLVGRERVAPLDFMPPLRAETLALLASVKENQVAQSYERNHVFAGPLPSGDDWAPIYLSPELIDTEYGSLLNITDQLLKGWSNAGQTTYERFDYPSPTGKGWPFDEPLPKAIHAGILTYNWNTQDVGGTVKAGKYDLVFFGTTGALHVSYLPGESGAHASQAERRGYQYFATSGDPNLARAMEYAAMFQVFRHFEITAAAPAAPVRLEAAEKVFEAAAVRVVASILGDRSADHHAPDPILVRKMAQVLASPRTGVLRFQQILAKEEGSDEDVEDLLIGLVARDLEQRLTTIPGLVAELVDLPALEAAYVEAANKRPDRWIHTPSIVISRNVQTMAGATGGHNVDATLRTFQAPNEHDLSTIQLGLLEPRPSEEAPRPIEQALSLPANRARTTERGFRPEKSTTLQFKAQEVKRPARTIPGEISPDQPLVVKKVDGVYQVRHGDHDLVASPSVADVTEQVLRAAPHATEEKPMIVDLGEMSEHDAVALRKNLEIQAKVNDVLTFRRLGPSKGGADPHELATATYDFSRAEVRTIEHRDFEDGRSAVGLEIRIPSKAQSKPTLLVKLRVFFGKLVPASVKESVTKWFEQIKHRLGGRDLSGHTLLRELRGDLRKEMQLMHPGLPDSAVDLQFGDGTDDVILVNRDIEVRDGARANRVPA